MCGGNMIKNKQGISNFIIIMRATRDKHKRKVKQIRQNNI